jgi:transcriptional regulator with XRE-family HTH domain
MTKSLHSGRYAVFLNLLRKARVEMGMTQTEVAKRLGVPPSYVSKCEAGERRLDVIELEAWLRAVDHDWLMFMARLGHALS